MFVYTMLQESGCKFNIEQGNQVVADRLNSGGGGGIGYQVADTGPVGWVNFWPGCSLVPKY